MPTVRRTTEHYLDMMGHALGKTPDSRHLLIHSLNDAGRALVNSHSWTWRTRNGFILPIKADQQHVELPEDFGEVLDLSVSTGQLYTVTQTTAAKINAMRSWNQYDALSLYMSFDAAQEGATDQDGVEENRAEIYPTPSADRSDILLDYRAKWIDMEADNLGRVPMIPRDWERSLMLFANAFAYDTENKSDPYENQALFGPTGEIQRLMISEAGRQVNRGRPKHNVLTNGAGVPLYPHQRITRS